MMHMLQILHEKSLQERELLKKEMGGNVDGKLTKWVIVADNARINVPLIYVSNALA